MTKCDQKTSRDNFFFNFMCIREGLVWHCRRWVSTPFAARLVFCCFFTQLINKLQQCSLCEWIKNILLFVLNTKQPLRDIWLLSYKQKSFQCFWKNLSSEFLAAMSSSRSDVVTQFVRPFVTKEFFFSLKSFNGVSRKLKGCLKLKGCFMEILFMF